MTLTAISTFLLLLSFTAVSLAEITDTSDAQSAYEALAGYGFPIGILPKGVVSYELDRTTGSFRANFNGSCSFALEGSYQLKYKSTITGYVSDRKLTQLRGVSVKVLFLWLNIVEVSRSGDNLYFSVGITSASFPLDNFYVCPQCGCGLDCDNVGKLSKIRRSNPFVSSI
ncbi:uncharacterized protein LOC126685683 [Mercurialis annua]|uniref:uncharacterized protein LOC126685683 n=1 Tax=Mercurialis annua TaxID=3986 RepID=UPI00215EC3D0|nr:uncharacterized protein LOC126685683 [Mercurialis annua]